MSHVEFEAFDCDNHYYEALDAFTRHLEPEFAKRTMQWADRRQAAAARRRTDQPLHPQPDVRPRVEAGRPRRVLRGRNPKGEDVRTLFGDLDPMSEHPEYPTATRLRLMDRQGLTGAIFLPTLGVGMEQALVDDPPALCAAPVRSTAGSTTTGASRTRADLRRTRAHLRRPRRARRRDRMGSKATRASS